MALRSACIAVFAFVAVAAARQSAIPQHPPSTNHEPTYVQTFDQPAAGARSARNANYDIDVHLDHRARTLQGHETIRWRNISAHPTSELQFHLYWNAWRDLESTFMRERQLGANFRQPRRDAWSRTDVTAVHVTVPGGGVRDVTSQQRFIAPDDGNRSDKTVMAVPLPFPVEPNETVLLDIEWTARIPRPFARTGYIGNYYFIGQWFPKLGVLQDDGWNTHQFHAATEFYSDYGVYDVRLTVPRGFVVGASGQQMERTDNTDGTSTHHYHGEDIHDFAWTTSPDYLERRQTFHHATLPPVEMRLLLQPEHEQLATRHFAATAATLKYYGEWFGAYPYPNITIIDPAFQSGSGGMEYPTLLTGGSRWIAPTAVAEPESTVVHEVGHQFWYGIVGSNEFENAWMDEGINTFSTGRVMEQAFNPNFNERRYFGGFIPWPLRDIPIRRPTDENRLTGYRNNAEADAPVTPTFRDWPPTAGIITYNKTALWLNTLERHLGWPVLQPIMSTYFDRWKFRHPTPNSFFEVVNEMSGQDLTWFFDQVYRSSNTFDYGVQELRSERAGGNYRTLVVARRFGEAIFPVDVVTTFKNGKQIAEHWDGIDRRAVYTYEQPTEAASVQVDPNRVLLLDLNYTNNSQTLQPRAAEASLKWALKWMVWLQELLLTYGFLS